MLIGIDMLGVQSPGSDSKESGRLGRQLVSALLANDSTNRYLLYTHEGLSTDQVPSARRALRVLLEADSDGSMARRRAIQRVLDLNPDGLDWLVLLDPFHELYGGIPPESPLNGVKVASIVTNLASTRVDDRRLAPLRGHDAILGFSRSTLVECRERLPEVGDRARRIGLAVDPSWSRSDHTEPLFESTASDLGRLGIIGPFLFANMASGTDRSNLGAVLEAYHRLPIEYQIGHQLVVAGEVDHPWAAVAYLHDHGCAEGLVLAGPVDESTLRTLYSRCSVFVSPSFGEASELPLVEAMSRGAAIVAGRIGDQADVLGDAGLFADPGDPIEIAGQVASVLDDPDLARQLRRKALARSSRFAWESVVEQFVGCLRSDESSRSTRRYRFDRAHLVRPRIALLTTARKSRPWEEEIDHQIARACLADCEVDLYLEPADLGFAEPRPAACSRFDIRQFARNDNMLGYEAVIHVLPDVFAVKPNLDRLDARPGLVILRDETSLDRIELPSSPSETVVLDLEAEVACQRLGELFLTGSSLGVRSSRNLEAIRVAFPAYFDQVIAISPILDQPVRGRSRRSADGSRPMAEWLFGRSVVVGDGSGRRRSLDSGSGFPSLNPPRWLLGPTDADDSYLETR